VSSVLFLLVSNVGEPCPLQDSNSTTLVRINNFLSCLTLLLTDFQYGLSSTVRSQGSDQSMAKGRGGRRCHTWSY
jgi:hypothetical protein